MATPFNPFGVGRGQRGGTAAGTTGTAARGRGAFSARGSQFQPRGGSASRASKYRGRGRGSLSQTFRGRGAGATARRGASHTGARIAEPGPEATNSPFAQLSQTKHSSAMIGEQQMVQTTSPFASNSAASVIRPSQNDTPPSLTTHIPTKGLVNESTGGPEQAVPVEDSSVLARYHERYDQLKVDRAKQRQMAIKSGQMADPNQPTSLNKAITPVGTCTSMCPEFERVERIVQKMVDKSEKYLHPSTNVLQNMETKMLKRFRRSAAGYDEQLPSDIRTPKALLQSTNYLIRHILGGNEPLGLIHKFVWDRTRSIRNDFSVQQLTQETDVKMAVTCLERIARFHIVSLHLLSSPENEEPFDRHQEREQLNNTMLSLMYYYDDNRGRVSFPNEDEFRAYYIIFSIHDQRPDLEARVQKWPASLLNSPRVQVALELYAASGNTWEYQGTLDSRRPNAIAQGFYTRFFNIINSPGVSYLMACVAEIYFSYVRQTAIRAIWKGYCRLPTSQQHKNEEWTVEELTKVLHFDNDEQTMQFCEEQDLQFAENANGQLYLNWGSRAVESVAFSPSSEHAFSETYVESKRTGRSLVAVILGLNVRQAARMGMVDPYYLHECGTVPHHAISPHDDDQALFVNGKDNQIPAPVVEIDHSPLSETLGSESTTSSARTAVQNFQSTLNATKTLDTQPSMATIMSQSSKPFASFSSGATEKGVLISTVAPSNPFSAPATSSFPPPKLPETSQPLNPFTSIFSGRTTQSSAPGPPAAAPLTNLPAPAPFTPPFVFPKPEEPSEKLDKKEQASTGNLTTNSASSLFSGSVSTNTVPSVLSATPANPFAASLASFGREQTSKESKAVGVPATTSSKSQQVTSLFQPTPAPSTSTEPKDNDQIPVATTLAPTPTSPSSFASAVPPRSSSPFKFPLEAPSSTSPFKSTPSAPSTSYTPQFPLPALNSKTELSSPAVAITAGPAVQSSSLSPAKPTPIENLSQAPQSPVSASLKDGKSEQPTTHDTAEIPEKPKAQEAVALAAETDQVDRVALEVPRVELSTNEDLLDEESRSSAFLSVYNIPKQFYPADECETSNEQAAIMQTEKRKMPPVASASATPLAIKRPKSSALPDSSKTRSTKKIKKKHALQFASAKTGVAQPSASAMDGATALQEPVFETDEERQAAWIQFIKHTRERQAHEKEKMVQKRATEEPVGGIIREEPGPKVAKGSVTDQVPHLQKYSLAEASVRKLPTLPCLERVEELLKRKEPSEEEVEEARAKRKRQIDEDEILLSAARIAAEQMRTGPKIFDGYSSYSVHSEPRRYSLSPRSSFSYSVPSSYVQSASPPQYTRHGYEVALAPDTPLAPGQTISRTEHRIRMTGAHGLAYKPLDFSKVKKDRGGGFSHSG